MDAYTAYNDILKARVLEDRREYDHGLLEKMYSLDELEADKLYQMIQANFDPGMQMEQIEAAIENLRQVEYVFGMINLSPWATRARGMMIRLTARKAMIKAKTVKDD